LDVFCAVIDIISVCGSIPLEIPILWPRAVMDGPRPRVLLTLPLLVCVWPCTQKRLFLPSITYKIHPLSQAGYT
jgi:hypothetical protein